MDQFDVLNQIDTHLLGIFAFLVFWYVHWAVITILTKREK